LRGVEIAADAVLKATKVDGIYDDDPVKNAQAIKFDRLTYDEVIARNLKVMDLAAFAMCREQQMPIVVFDMFKQDALLRIVQGEQEGTLVTGEVQ
jgi:uridylate kinase